MRACDAGAGAEAPRREAALAAGAFALSEGAPGGAQGFGMRTTKSPAGLDDRRAHTTILK